VEFAENSPFPPPQSAEEGVYCEGCHIIHADWKRPKEEVMPPRSCVKAEWPMTSDVAVGARSSSAGKAAAPKAKPAKKSARAGVRAKAGR
jgi:hypothetical protein